MHPLLRNLIPLCAIVAVAGSIFSAGILRQEGAKNIDARYFYVAAKCWAAGKSPYEPATYRDMYREQFGAPPDAIFVAYLPTLMLVVLPMAPFSWPVAAQIFSILNFLAAMILFWACYRLVAEAAERHLSATAWLWITIGSTVGGISGTILTGQTSVFAAAGCGLALVGSRLTRNWMTAAGLVIASAKPHLSAPLLIFIVASEWRHRRALAIAAVATVLICGYAALTDENIIRSYLGSISTYNSLAVNDPARQVGLVTLLLRAGIPLHVAQIIGASALAIVMLFMTLQLWRSKRPLSECAPLMMVLVFCVGLARPVQGYDLCIYALGIALLGAVDPRSSLVFVVPAILIWRPRLPDLLHLTPLPQNIVTSIAWLAMFTGALVLACRRQDGMLAFNRTNPPQPHLR